MDQWFKPGKGIPLLWYDSDILTPKSSTFMSLLHILIDEEIFIIDKVLLFLNEIQNTKG